MKRKHEMPFGAACLENDGVRFRLWAPKAKSVSLRLSEEQQDLAMLRSEDGEGWFDLISPQAKSGSNYQFVIDGEHVIPDPASRFQPSGVHGTSAVVDPLAYDWHDDNWRGRPWAEAVIYELHVGTFSPQGTYALAEEKLDYLVDLGVTAVELMPLSSFPGQRNWGYDGVLPYAPASPYGRPEELKHFIESAHARNLMVFLDVVYNHFGPEGNYLHLYAPQFFTERHHTPWGPAINFDGSKSREVRDFFIHNALYWLEEFHFDGLRLDAVHAIVDDSHPDFLTELAETVRETIGCERHIHLVLENEDNAARYLLRDAGGCDAVGDRPRMRQIELHEDGGDQSHPRWYDAQWNDDIHHALHVLLTGESKSYFEDYANDPIAHLGRCLTDGFAYQGETSRFRNNQRRGEPSQHLPLTCFVSFLQNHDQVGNRALGERITELADPAIIRAAVAILLLAPSPPLLFMGEEFGATTPFLFFCDFGAELAAKVREGRRREFPEHHSGSDEIPDPNSEQTFLRSKLDWSSVRQPAHAEWLNFYQALLRLRRENVVPRIDQIVLGEARYRVLNQKGLLVRWLFGNGGCLELLVNFGRSALLVDQPIGGHLIFSTVENRSDLKAEMPPLAVAWFLAETPTRQFGPNFD